MRWFIAPVVLLALAAPAEAKQRPTGGYVCGENGCHAIGRIPPLIEERSEPVRLGEPAAFYRIVIEFETGGPLQIAYLPRQRLLELDALRPVHERFRLPLDGLRPYGPLRMLSRLPSAGWCIHGGCTPSSI
jgi:hypothetical protein